MTTYFLSSSSHPTPPSRKNLPPKTGKYYTSFSHITATHILVMQPLTVVHATINTNDTCILTVAHVFFSCPQRPLKKEKVKSVLTPRITAFQVTNPESKHNLSKKIETQIRWCAVQFNNGLNIEVNGTLFTSMQTTKHAL